MPRKPITNTHDWPPHPQAGPRDAWLTTVLVIGLGFGSHPGYGKPPDTADMDVTIAVIPAIGSDLARTAADGLERRLAHERGITLVNRAELEVVLTEQRLGAALRPEGIHSRVELGKVVRADMLVFVRERGEPDPQALEQTIAETRRGLRISTQTCLADPEQIEATLDAFSAAVMRVRASARKPFRLVFAVPPFVSKDLSPRYAYERQGFARLVEAYLMQLPNVAVVEMAEAQALAEDVAVSGGKVARHLPYYVLGAYNTMHESTALQIAMSIELRHGEQVTGSRSTNELRASEVGRWVLDTVEDLVRRIEDRPHTFVPRKLETCVLNDRASLFRRIGEWDVALPLYESTLLLDPNNRQARLRVFEGHSELAYSFGGQSTPHTERYRVRVRHMDRALDHLALLLEALPFDDELRRRMSRFGLNYAVYGYNIRTDPERIHTDYRRLRRRRSDMVLELLADPARSAKLTHGQIDALADFIFRTCRYQTPWNPDSALDTVYRLIQILDGHGTALRSMFVAAIYVGIGRRDLGSPYEAFLNRLERSESKVLRVVGQASRIAHAAEDRESISASVNQLKQLLFDHHLDDLAATLVPLARWGMDVRLGASVSTVEENVMVPTLKPLASSLRIESLKGQSVPKLAALYDWVQCGLHAEVVATDRGIFRLASKDRLVQVHTGPATRLHWDGKYVWTLNGSGAPVFVLDPLRGEVARFDNHEVAFGAQILEAHLAPTRPGEACFIGSLHQEPNSWRTWATLLTVENAPSRPVSKSFERIYEARGVRNNLDPSNYAGPDTAFTPWWAKTMSAAADSTDPLVLIGSNLPQTLILDPVRKTMRPTKHRWPYWPRVIRHQGNFYIAAGQWRAYGRGSAVYTTDHLDQAPQRLVNFDERPFELWPLPSSTYFRSITIFDNTLHLLAARRFQPTRTWVAIDLDTLESYHLVSRFRHHTHIRALDRRFRVSRTYGLILFLDRKAYRVELPPQATWPVIAARTSSEAR